MIIFRDKNTCYSLFLNTLYIFLLISITLLPNNGYYAKSTHCASNEFKTR